MKIDHVGIEVRDLFTMELFYRRALGFTPGYRYVSRNTPGLRTVFLRRDGVSVELLERPRDDGFLARRAQAPDHLSLEVEDVDAAYARLAALGLRGVGLKPPRDTGDGFREAELRDPEGNVIELSTRVRPEPRYPVRAVIVAAVELRAHPELVRLVELLGARGVPVAIASSPPPDPAAHGDPLEPPGAPAVRVSAEEVPRRKPSPDLFLEAARRLGVPPEECAVVETDADGVEAAKRAFMRCIAAPRRAGDPPDARLAMADLLLEGGLATFDAGAALAWLAPLLG
jgi:HAD superfamily hydrolase (TIGR01509 family)